MRIAAFSDSHGDTKGLAFAIEQAARHGKPEAFLFCGDGVRDFMGLEDRMRAINPAAEILAVRGNNDLGFLDVPDERVMDFHGTRVLLCHGHRQQVKSTMGYLQMKARENQCAIAIFGHTHRAQIEERGGVWLLNPGACGWTGCSALILTIQGNGCFTPELVLR